MSSGIANFRTSEASAADETLAAKDLSGQAKGLKTKCPEREGISRQDVMRLAGIRLMRVPKARKDPAFGYGQSVAGYKGNKCWAGMPNLCALLFWLIVKSFRFLPISYYSFVNVLLNLYNPAGYIRIYRNRSIFVLTLQCKLS